MLSHKKSTLIHCLLKNIASDVNSTLQPTSSASGGPFHHMAGGNKSTLINRFNLLWSYLLSKCCCAGQVSHNPNSRHPTPQLIEEVAKRLHCLRKRDLRHLWKVIQGGGIFLGQCILVSQHTNCEGCQQLHSSPASPAISEQINAQLLVFLMWRWSRAEINHRHLQPLPWCLHHSSDNGWEDIAKQHFVCINPYHWSLRIPDCSFESVLAQLKRIANGQLVTTASLSSMSTDDSELEEDSHLVEPTWPPYQYYALPSSTPPPSYSEAYHNSPANVTFPYKRDSPKSVDSENERNSTWCRLKYWEEKRRIGKDFSVISESTSVSSVSVEGDGLCLQTLYHRHAPLTPDICKIRHKIGLGLSLFRDSSNCVWVYNRSSCDIFVCSPTLNPELFQRPNSTDLAVKLLPGHIVKAYDYQVVDTLKSYLQSSRHTPMQGHWLTKLGHLLNSNSFTISFVKGFGSSYTRQEIMQCPCWLEVILDFANQFSPTPSNQ